MPGEPRWPSEHLWRSQHQIGDKRPREQHRDDHRSYDDSFFGRSIVAKLLHDPKDGVRVLPAPFVGGTIGQELEQLSAIRNLAAVDLQLNDREGDLSTR